MAGQACSFQPLAAGAWRPAAEPDANLWAHADFQPELLRGGAAAMPGLADAIAALRREGVFDAFEAAAADDASPDDADVAASGDGDESDESDDGDSDDSDSDSDSDSSDSDDSDSDGDDGDDGQESASDAAEPEVEITTVRASPAMLPLIQDLVEKSRAARGEAEVPPDDASALSEDYVTDAPQLTDAQHVAAAARMNEDGDLMAIDARTLFQLLGQRQPVAPLRTAV